jgi:hypothetical protein
MAFELRWLLAFASRVILSAFLPIAPSWMEGRRRSSTECTAHTAFEGFQEPFWPKRLILKCQVYHPACI